MNDYQNVSKGTQNVRNKVKIQLDHTECVKKQQKTGV